MRTSLVALLGYASSVLAATRGFNYASQGKTYQTFKSDFSLAQSLSGASGFSSARLYTMIQDGTTNTPISAIQAAIDTKTTLLLGLWASQDQSGFNNELAALQSAISQYGSSFADLVVGISVGSEDLYRISATGIANKAGVGQDPTTLVSYISQVRSAISGTVLSSKKVGHVDTWNVYVNGTNSPVIAASDFLGLDEYPYFQTTDSNDINSAAFLFFQAYNRVNDVAQGKPIWITETGWPVTGPTSNLATASTSNAAIYWQQVACALENRNVPMWWYILNEDGATPNFGVSTSGQPHYNLACNATAGYVSTSSSASSSATGLMTTMSAGATMTVNGSTTVLASATIVSATGVSSASAGRTTTATATTSSSATRSSSASASSFTGAASKVEGSVAALVIGAVAAVLAL